MDIVQACRIFVVARFDGYFVISIRLTRCFIPADIILAVLSRPDRNLNSTNALRTVDILDDDVKGSCILVVVFDRKGTG